MIAVWSSWWLVLAIAGGCDAVNPQQERFPTLHWWIHDDVAASTACGNNDQWTVSLANVLTVHLSTLKAEQDRRLAQVIKYGNYCGDPTKCKTISGGLAGTLVDTPSEDDISSEPMEESPTESMEAPPTAPMALPTAPMTLPTAPMALPMAPMALPTAPIASPSTPISLPTTKAPVASPVKTKAKVKDKGKDGGRVRRRVESLSTKARSSPLDYCDRAQRKAYDAVQSSLWTSACRDYLAQHSTEWVCQFD
jgi:hypothetical protein